MTNKPLISKPKLDNNTQGPPVSSTFIGQIQEGLRVFSKSKKRVSMNTNINPSANDENGKITQLPTDHGFFGKHMWKQFIENAERLVKFAPKENAALVMAAKMNLATIKQLDSLIKK